MKTIGLLGGVSWESTAVYYRLINEAVRTRLGGFHSAPMAIVSLDFHEIETLQREARWLQAAEILSRAAQRIEAAGADLLLICSNTMHKGFEPVRRSVSIPVLHIADATGTAVRRAGQTAVGLLGTRFTMEERFLIDRLQREHGLQVLIPEAEDREAIDRIIYEELCLGIVRDASREAYRRIIDALTERGAQGVILGCTEIGILVGPEDTDAPLFDTTRIHAEAAVEYALT
jgi:aspartate racemase